jgi:peptidyl-prolyl cis-trans isomerase A (cyclophilin A)
MQQLLTAILALSLSFTAWAQNPQVELDTVHGSIIIELDVQAAPISVKNFLHYVDRGYYTATLFHRVIPGFMVQGGGFGSNGKSKKGTKDPIINEASNGLSNLRGTVAMARTSSPDSATAQFFINHQDNPFLDKSASSAGYAVFGKVIKGMGVVDKITQVPTKTKGMYRDWPAQKVLIYQAYNLNK